MAAWKDKYLRLAAEYDNYRKRTQKERESLYAGAVADSVVRFLPIYDNLQRALSLQTEDMAFYKGVELIQTGLLAVFEKMGVRPIEALGQPFDPELHDAVMHIEDDTDEQNVVAEVFQTGFALDDQVIRHAMVKVKN
ncbi:MAG: nucleotide exchange factor GrpE [Oscillospiraceae bacterium]|nr:nucleotide exchange factor GrpE [Oscillospiraceae bacterium]